ncbi:M15 family metallopeptidase [Devosia honganensis]|uniref:M15 family metallopeptidase n=1 Tax=Devosia honganensis TaxID=1610527 RepID=A0ABV7X2W9_9HYPH
MRDREFLASLRHQEQQFRAGREGAHPFIVAFEGRFIRRMRALGVPMFAHEVWRMPERQDELYRAGRSKAKAGQSPHNFGCAVDLVHGTQGWNLNDQQWSLIGHVGKEVALSLGVKLVWGGDWKFYDPAHWELADWRVIRGVFQSNPDVRTVPEALALLAKERSQV